jgi:hypothetical protein
MQIHPDGGHALRGKSDNGSISHGLSRFLKMPATAAGVGILV